MAYNALGPVSVGIYNLLNVAGLTALVSTRIYDDVPQAPTFPFVWYEVQARETRGMGMGSLPEIELRVHTYSKYLGSKEAQEIDGKVIELLRDKAVTVTGYNQAGLIIWDDTIPLRDEAIQGVKCGELVSMFRLYVEEA